MLAPFELTVVCLILYLVGNSNKQVIVGCTAIGLICCSQPALRTDATASFIGIGGAFGAVHRI